MQKRTGKKESSLSRNALWQRKHTMTKKARELSQIFGYEVFTAMYDKKRNKLFLHSTNSKFCHKDVAKLLEESIQNANTKPCVSVYDDDHVKE